MILYLVLIFNQKTNTNILEYNIFNEYIKYVLGVILVKSLKKFGYSFITWYKIEQVNVLFYDFFKLKHNNKHIIGSKRICQKV